MQPDRGAVISGGSFSTRFHGDFEFTYHVGGGGPAGSLAEPRTRGRPDLVAGGGIFDPAERRGDNGGQISGRADGVDDRLGSRAGGLLGAAEDRRALLQHPQRRQQGRRRRLRVQWGKMPIACCHHACPPWLEWGDRLLDRAIPSPRPYCWPASTPHADFSLQPSDDVPGRAPGYEGGNED